MSRNYFGELWHHGIPGMQHGKRRFQNEDGSLTELGRRRYGIGLVSGTRNVDAQTANMREWAQQQSVANPVTVGSRATSVQGAVGRVSDFQKGYRLAEQKAKAEREAAEKAKTETSAKPTTESIQKSTDAGQAALEKLLGEQAKEPATSDKTSSTKHSDPSSRKRSSSSSSGSRKSKSGDSGGSESSGSESSSEGKRVTANAQLKKRDGSTKDLLSTKEGREQLIEKLKAQGVSETDILSMLGSSMSETMIDTVFGLGKLGLKQDDIQTIIEKLMGRSEVKAKEK